ncbi:MAG: hypothetical protein ACJAZP_001878 [Psychromonas sp.]|jgi:hypothetical protein
MNVLNQAYINALLADMSYIDFESSEKVNGVRSCILLF